MIASSARALWLLLVSLCLATAARAMTVPDLYEVSTPVTTTRDAAFGDALKAVVVRVSGRRDAPARLGAVGNPRQYVQRFGFTADNVLQVGFDSVSIDALLTGAGLPVWGRERPATLVLLSVAAANGSSSWVDSRGASAEREAISRAARERGLPIVWPDGPPGDVSAGATSALLQIATSYSADAVLLGTQEGSVTQWTLVSADTNGNTSGSLGDGVELAADTFGRIYSASGSTLSSVMVDVSGINTLGAYASTLNYLEGLTLVRSVAVEQVVGDTMKFRLAVRGNADTLRRSLALDGKLLPADAGDAATPPAGHLQFRFRP